MADIHHDDKPEQHDGDPHAFTDPHASWGLALAGPGVHTTNKDVAPTPASRLLTIYSTPCADMMNTDTEDADMPKWAIKMQTELTAEISKVSAKVENLIIDVNGLKKSVRLAYCRPGHTAGLTCDKDACIALLNCSRLSASSMLSVNEIAADYVVNDRSVVGPRGGDCQEAARVAFDFFSDFKLMRPGVKGGVLYSPSGHIRWSAAISEAAGSPDKDGVIDQQMKAYKLVEGSGCVWAPSPDEHPDAVGTPGHKHFVACVTALDGVVAVDWGILQFDLPDDVVLFV